MRIQNLKVAEESQPALTVSSLGLTNLAAAPAAPPSTELPERQTIEIAFLKARIQHLELVVETARSLLGSSQERLLRQLHDVPLELVTLGAQLRRVDPLAAG